MVACAWGGVGWGLFDPEPSPHFSAQVSAMALPIQIEWFKFPFWERLVTPLES